MPPFDTPEPISARIDIVVGEVRVRAEDRDDTVVSVEPTDPSNREDVKAAELTRVEYADGQLLVKASKLRSWSIRSHGGSIDVTVELPTGSHVNGSLGMADLDAAGRLGDLRIKTGLGHVRLDQAATLIVKTGAGDVEADRVTGPADVTVGSGAVRLREIDGGAVVKNSNGDTWIGVAAGDLRIRAANGSIAVDLAQADVSAKSANGDVRLREVVRGSAVLETQVGDVEVGIREGTAAWLDVSASAGKVRNTLTAADAPGQSTETVEVRARTSLGEIVIGRP